MKFEVELTYRAYKVFEVESETQAEAESIAMENANACYPDIEWNNSNSWRVGSIPSTTRPNGSSL
jgi:hypothetical protein